MMPIPETFDADLRITSMLLSAIGWHISYTYAVFSHRALYKRFVCLRITDVRLCYHSPLTSNDSMLRSSKATTHVRTFICYPCRNVLVRCHILHQNTSRISTQLKLIYHKSIRTTQYATTPTMMQFRLFSSLCPSPHPPSPHHHHPSPLPASSSPSHPSHSLSPSPAPPSPPSPPSA